MSKWNQEKQMKTTREFTGNLFFEKKGLVVLCS